MRISAKQYAQTLYEITDGKPKPEIEKSVADFARYIYRNRKLKLAGKIMEQFAAMYNKKKGIVEVEVVTVQKMDEALEKKVKHFVREKYGAKEVILKNIVDENIKGGIISKVGDEVVDSSIGGKIEGLRRLLVGK